MKTRLDFVSNSSSSSYIIAVGPEYTSRMAAQDVAEKTFGDGFEDVADFFENKTVLTAIEIEYRDWNDKYNDWMYNFIPPGICVDDEELDKWFDAMCYGHIYIAETENWKRGIEQRMLEDSDGIKEAWYIDS